MKKRLQTIIAFLLIIGNYASAQPEKVVKDFGEAMSSWCNTDNIMYREIIESLCSGKIACRVKDKIITDYQKKRGLTNYETLTLNSYLNVFQIFIKQNVQFQMGNVKLVSTEISPYGELSYVTADIKVSGPVNYTITDSFHLCEGKIIGIYSAHIDECKQPTLELTPKNKNDNYNYGSTFGRYRTFVKTRNGCSKCDCSGYWGYKHGNGTYEGSCSNSDGHGHTCVHGPEKHGLRKW